VRVSRVEEDIRHVPVKLSLSDTGMPQTAFEVKG
jgi:hypothetical protein